MPDRPIPAAKWPSAPFALLLSAAVGLGLVATPRARATPSATAMMILGRGMPRGAYNKVLEELDQRPDDPDLHAQLGLILVKMGAFTDAIESFEMSTGGGAYYEKIGGLRQHADALREAGRPLEAAALRREALAVATEKTGLMHYIGLIADYRTAHRYAEAREVGIEAVAAYPRASTLYAYLAELEWEAGNREEAAWLLWESDRLQTSGVYRGHLLRAYMDLEEGLYKDVRRTIRRLRTRNLRNPDVLALRVELDRREFGPETALDTLDEPQWEYQRHPMLRLLRAQLHMDLGELEAASALVEEVAELYPDRDDLVATRARLGALKARGLAAPARP